jgi:hypothetical protein
MFKNSTLFGKSFSLIKTAQKAKEQVMLFKFDLGFKMYFCACTKSKILFITKN